VSSNKDILANPLAEDIHSASGASSIFISPRMKQEEEFKVPKSVLAQSLREEGPTGL
jgi:hypothetical protein